VTVYARCLHFVITVAAEKEQDSVYEVLFDEEFLGGLNIRLVYAESLCESI